jgi:transposase
MSAGEWRVIEPALPAPAWKAGKGGRPAEHCRRDIVDAIRYLVKKGIQWRAMPADFPPWQTAYGVLDGWQKSGATEQMHSELRRQCRIAARGFQNSATGADLGFYAAGSYSLRRRPRTVRSLIRWRERSATGWSGLGGRS